MDTKQGVISRTRGSRRALGGARSEREWAKTTIPVSKVRPGSGHRYHKLKKLRGLHDKKTLRRWSKQVESSSVSETTR